MLNSNSISRTELKELRLHQHLHLNGDEVTEETNNPVLQKLQKWADYPSYNTWVESTRFDFRPCSVAPSFEVLIGVIKPSSNRLGVHMLCFTFSRPYLQMRTGEEDGPWACWSAYNVTDILIIPLPPTGSCL